MSWEDVSYIIRGKNRKSVILELETPKTPTMLARTLKTSMPNISRTLTQLQNKGFVTCLTPEERVGKIYSLTDKGKETLKKIAEMTQ
jgi:DNA-binding PadR family transcriptional regulator